MGFQISAGVEVKEIDLTNIIPTVSTTEGALAGHSVWGPVGQRVLVSSQDQLVSQFGKPNSNTASDFFTGADFLDYGNKLYFSRAVNANTTGGNLGGLHARNAHCASANGKNTVIKSETDFTANYSTGISGVGHAAAKYPGELGNSLRWSVCPSANAYQSTLTGTFAFTNNSTTVTGTGSSLTNQIRIGDIVLAGPDRIPIKVASTTNTTVMVLSQAYAGNTVTGVTTTRRWEFHNYFDAAPGTSEFVSLQAGSSDEMHIVVVDEDGRVSGSANTVIEKYSKVSKATDAKTADGAGNYWKNVISQRSQWLWPMSSLTGVTNDGKKAAGVSFGVGTQSRSINDSLVNGRDGAAPREADYIAAYNLFTNPEAVDISFVLGGASTQTRAIHIINNIVEVRKDCIAVLSPRNADVVNNSSYIGKESDDSITFRNLLPSTSYATMDSGWKYRYDKYNDLYRYTPLNGDTAGLMVRTDTTNDPWWSPAGYNRGQIKNVIKLSWNPNKAQRDQLYKNGINPVVTFPGQGTVLFGDKTLLAKPSAFDRINVRRLFIVLEKAIAIAAKYTLFEFNDEFTRSQFRNMVEPFLRDVQGRRGIFDFRVICDTTNNTPEVIDRNEFVGSIFVKPARSINFITLNFVAVRTGVEFTEVVGAV